MLTKLLKLPYRRFDREKLREQIGGVKPNLQTLGHLAVWPRSACGRGQATRWACTRSADTSLLSWKEGFALVMTSNSAGHDPGLP